MPGRQPGEPCPRRPPGEIWYRRDRAGRDPASLGVISRGRPGWRAGDIRVTDGRPPQPRAARPPPVHVPQKPPPTSRISSRAPAKSRRNRTVPV